MDNEATDQDPTAPLPGDSEAAAENEPGENAPAAEQPAKSRGVRDWGRGYERQLAIAALIVAIVALVVGAAGLREAHKNTTKTEPTKTTTTVPGQIEVPDVVGKNAIDASVALKAKKLTSKVVKTKSATVKKGLVISQKPAAGAKVAQNASVELTVSDGP